jgi:hypothetical protein
MNKKIYSIIIGLLSVSIIYLLINTKQIINNDRIKTKELEQKIKQKNDSLQLFIQKYEDESNFSLASNPDAKELFYQLDIDGDVTNFILEELFKTNDKAPNNKLVPYEGTMGGVMKINNARVLNNKWIIADYSDGYFWGEILVEYRIDEQNKITFNTINENLYPHR